MMVWPRDRDDDGLDGVGGGVLAGHGRVAIEDDVGREAESENAEQGLSRRAGHAVGGEADAEEGKRVLHWLHDALHRVARGPGDLEDDGTARAGARERGIGNALGVEVA